MIDLITSFLINREWTSVKTTDIFHELRPPNDLKFPEEFRLFIPTDSNKSDSKRFLDNLIEIVAEIYSLNIEDLNVIFKNQDTVLKVRVYDEQTINGRMPLNRFEEFIDKIRSILSDTASFVIDKDATSIRIPEEVSRYLNLCNFMQTEIGSFIAKIQLPTTEIIKESELFERQTIYSEEINTKLSEVLKFINEDIFESTSSINDEYLIENENKINIKLLKDIESFFDKAGIKNIDFTFHSIKSTEIISNKNITKQKLNRLNQLVEYVKKSEFQVGVFTLKGRITALKSQDPDGLRNSVIFSGLIDNIIVTGTAYLTSENYREAIEAHKLKQNIEITGLSKRTKTKIKFTEVTNFVIEDF
ncbi:hypothetical protein OQZ29_10110 [Pedobacter agri]|uniref:Uncharacterized protein n=2 Tax=Pedobacter agri TaxID=454586 RepID=A0A9X3DD20_9SPHI|nr:hypothetical protein [Pedobacter agri]MCX3265102.1 hypothetical protein [Pedobacter agri]